jgi:hypothetical protein
MTSTQAPATLPAMTATTEEFVRPPGAGGSGAGCDDWSLFDDFEPGCGTDLVSAEPFAEL